MENWLPLILFLLIQCGTPGPHNLTCLYLGAKHGLKGAAGFISASLCMVFLKAFLCGWLNMLLLRRLPSIVNWIKWVGAVYILYLAVKMILSGWREAEAGKEDPEDPDWKSGVVLQVFSGKSWIMCLSLFASFGAQLGADLRNVLLICFLLLTISIAMSLLWTSFGFFLRGTIRRHKKLFGTVMGASLVYCAVKAVM